MHQVRSSLTLILLALSVPISCLPVGQWTSEASVISECKDLPKRPIVVISDLHFGIGEKEKDEWDPTEDFRWSAELARFLDRVPEELGDAVDLVIAGDLLELWQPRDDLKCAADKDSTRNFASNPELGCDINEMEKILDVVIEEHRADLLKLGSFANKQHNRLFILPGNHDAAISHAILLNKLKSEFGKVSDDRLVIVPDGIWASDDCLVVIEHGNQIRPDVNRFDSWPHIVSQGFFSRPWGELFVQRLYNKKERDYPLIDNLIPESSGVSYYARMHGIVGNVTDFARFLFFNLFQTSLNQKGAFLGAPDKQPIEWDISYARTELGHRLFASAMAYSDPMRNHLLSDEGRDWAEVRAHLDAIAKDKKVLSDNDIRMLCDQAAIRHGGERTEASGGNQKSASVLCQVPKSGELLKRLLIPHEWLLRRHLNDLLPKYPKMTTFVYGHTHVRELPWTVNDLQFGRSVTVVNSGAFQRIVDGDTFGIKATLKGRKPDEALEALSFDDLPSCYSAVFIRYESSAPKPEVHNWYDDNHGTFDLVAGNDARCSKISL